MKESVLSLKENNNTTLVFKLPESTKHIS